MILKLRIQYYDDTQLNQLLDVLKQQYTILFVSDIHESKRQNNLYKYVFVEMLKK